MPDANLESGLGLSSLERVELLSALEDRYQVDLSETQVRECSDRRRSGKTAAGQVRRCRQSLALQTLRDLH